MLVKGSKSLLKASCRLPIGVLVRNPTQVPFLIHRTFSRRLACINMYAAQQPTSEPATIPHKATKRAFRPARACQILSHTLIAAIASSLLQVSTGLQFKAQSAIAEGQRRCTQASPAGSYNLCTVSTGVERPPQGLQGSAPAGRVLVSAQRGRRPPTLPPKSEKGL